MFICVMNLNYCYTHNYCNVFVIIFKIYYINFVENMK